MIYQTENNIIKVIDKIERNQKKEDWKIPSQTVFDIDECYFITCRIFEQKPLLDSFKRKSEFETFLFNILFSFNATIRGWAILPDHFHLLIEINNEHKIANIMKQVFGVTAYLWNKEDLTFGRKIWCNYNVQKILNEGHFYATLNYIHYDPVKHSHVLHPFEWEWSSLQFYMKENGRGWLVDKMIEYPFHQYPDDWED